MRMRFEPGLDDEEYVTARDALLDEFAGWLRDSRGPDRDKVVADVEMFLDWRYFYSSGVLDDFNDSDIAEFLLDWCPAKYAAPADVSHVVCRAVGTFIEFMASAGRLVGGVDRAARLITLAEGLVPQMQAAMDDSAKFGMGKSLFPDVPLAASMSEEELQVALLAQMEEFNAKPFEERKALTERFVNPPPPSIELPFIYVPPSATDVEAAVARAPLLAKVGALREYLGAGRALTQRGNLKLADGRALIGLLDTGDVMDPEFGDRTFRTGSTENLRGLAFIVDVAKEAGAVRVHQRRLVPVKAWVRRTSVEQATALYAAVIELGPLWWRGRRGLAFYDDFHRLLDDGIVHWLAPLLAQDTEAFFDGIVELAEEVVAEQVVPIWPHWRAEELNMFTEHDVSRIFQVLEMAGVVDWIDPEQVPTRWGDCYPGGGTIRLTALGRNVIPDYLPDAGYVLRRVGDLADADAATLIEALDSVPDTQHEALLAVWQPTRPSAERAAMITGAIAAAESARSRLTGFVALEMFDLDVVAPLARQLLDSPAAGHAALWLMGHGLADPDTVGSFIDVGVFVDVLAATLDDPEELCELFTSSPDADQPYAVLEDMWRHPAPETAAVLDALGRHLPDRKLAKAARKAAVRHRSWMASRR